LNYYSAKVAEWRS